MAGPIATFFAWVGTAAKDAWIAFKAAETITQISIVLTAASVGIGVKGYLQTKAMLAKGQDIMANKIAAGGKIPVVYGTRRVGAQIVYMDTAGNSSTHLYVVYALSVGECEEIMGQTIELSGNSLRDSKQFRNGGYIGTDKISSGNGSLCTANQNSGSVDLTGGTFGTNPALGGYRYVMNLHHGAASQAADPMLRASIASQWTTAHKLNGVAYIAASYIYDSKGQFRGVPELTVQVKGRKVFDPRDNSTGWSSNPALCFLDYIQNNDYGKGLTTADINMSTFSSAANKADTLVNSPYFNGDPKALTWSGSGGDNFIKVLGGAANILWWQNKVGDLIDLYDTNGNGVIDGLEITALQRDQFFDENAEYLVFFDGTLSSNYSSQSGTSRSCEAREAELCCVIVVLWIDLDSDSGISSGRLRVRCSNLGISGISPMINERSQSANLGSVSEFISNKSGGSVIQRRKSLFFFNEGASKSIRNMIMARENC